VPLTVVFVPLTSAGVAVPVPPEVTGRAFVSVSDGMLAEVAPYDAVLAPLNVSPVLSSFE
jgi:hypothetical protein